MIELFFRWRLWKLDRAYNRLDNKLAAEEAGAKLKGASQEELVDLHNERGDRFFQYDVERKALITRHLAGQANRYFVPWPSIEKGSPYWEESYYSAGSHVLTEEGIKKVRTEIREEKRARRESAVAWIAIITGLIGALTGLMAIILK